MHAYRDMLPFKYSLVQITKVKSFLLLNCYKTQKGILKGGKGMRRKPTLEFKKIPNVGKNRRSSNNINNNNNNNA